MKETNKLHAEDFNNAEDIGVFLDHHNELVEKKGVKRSEDDISEISKMVVRIMNKKTIV